MNKYTLRSLLLIVFFVFWAGYSSAYPPPCSESWTTTYNAIPYSLQAGYIVDHNGNPVSSICTQYTGPISSIFTWLYALGINTTFGNDTDQRIVIHAQVDCSTVTTIDYVADNVHISMVTPDFSVISAGTYYVTASWDDAGVPNYATDSAQTRTLTITFWAQGSTLSIAPISIQGGNILDGTNSSITTLSVPINGPISSLSSWLSNQGIHATNGVDTDTLELFNRDSSCNQYTQTSYVKDSVVTYFPYSVNTSNKILWSVSTGGQPSVAYGKVYYGAGDGIIYARDILTGAIVWTYQTGDGIGAIASIANGIVFVGSQDGIMYGLNALTGNLLCKYQTGGATYNAAITRDAIYFGSSDNNIYAFSSDTLADNQDSPTYKYDNARNGINVNSNIVSQLALKWVYNVGSSPSGPVVANGKVYFGASNGKMYALDASVGTTVWTYQTGGTVGTPAVCGGVVYFGAQDNYVYALNANTSTLIWRKQTGSWVRSAPVVENGIVYISSWDGNLYAYDTSAGAIVWSDALNIQEGTPTVVNGIVYQGDNDGVFHALRADNGNSIWSQELSGSVTDAVAVTNDVVYVWARGGDTLYALSTAPINTFGNYTISAKWDDLPIYADDTAVIKNVIVQLWAISSVNVSLLSDTSVQISWNTNLPTSSQISYGLTTVYGSITPADSTLVYSHSQIIYDLLPMNTYHFSITSQDGQGHSQTVGDFVLAVESPSTMSISLVTSNPPVAIWSSQSNITVAWSISSGFNTISGYKYTFDQIVDTSICPSSATEIDSPTAISTTLSSGIYYFHLWTVNLSGIVNRGVYTVGPFFLDTNASNLPILGDIPDIKLLNSSAQITVLNLSDYVSNTAASWSYSIESSWQFNTNLGITISQSGNQMIYSPTSSSPAGQERIKYTADGVFNDRSILKLSSNLWNQKFPDVLFKKGIAEGSNVIPLLSYITSANYPTTAQFIAKVIDASSNISCSFNSSTVTLTASSTISFPVRIRVQVANSSNATTDLDSQILWAREDLVDNGDFQSSVTDYWAYIGNATNFSQTWVSSKDSQNGVLQLQQWGYSTVQIASPFIPLHGGSWYTLRGKFKKDQLNPNQTLIMELDGYSGFSSSTTITAVAATTVPVTTQWQPFEMSFYNRANLVSVVFFGKMTATQSVPISSIYMDDIQLIEKEPPVNTAYGNTQIKIKNSSFTIDTSYWVFEPVIGTSLGQVQDTSSYNGRNGVCVLSLTTTGTKLTQWVTFNDSSSRSVRIRVWAATDTTITDPNATPRVTLILAGYDQNTDYNTQHLLGVADYVPLHVEAGGHWTQYEFACPISAPVVAVQLQGKGYGSSTTILYLDDVQIDREQDSPSYWSNDEIMETELVQVDTSKTLFFTTAESNQRFIPFGGNFHIGGHGIEDSWWNPYSEDSYISLYLDRDFQLMRDLGGNAIKLSLIMTSLLPDSDYEISPPNSDPLFPTSQSGTSIQIPNRMLDRLDQMVALAKRHHLRVILTVTASSRYPNWWFGGGGYYGDTTNLILSQLWTVLAQRYKNDPGIISYSFSVEHQGVTMEWTDTTYAYSVGTVDKYYAAPVSTKWHNWLAKKYNNDINQLNSAWNAIPLTYRKYTTESSYTIFNSVPIPGWDGRNTIGSSDFTTGGGINTTYHIPNAPTRDTTESGPTIHWTAPTDGRYLNCYYIWRKEKGNSDPNFGTTWRWLAQTPLSYSSYSDGDQAILGNISTYRYWVTGGNQDAWRNYLEGTPENENTTYDPMLFDYLQFRESIVDTYNYNQSSTIAQMESGGKRHLSSTGLAQFDYLYRWPVPYYQWGNIPKMTPESPHSTLAYNVKELGKSLDFIEMSFYTQFPLSPVSQDNPDPGYRLSDDSGNTNYLNEMVKLQYLRTLLRLSYTNPSTALQKPTLLKEFSGEGDLSTLTQTDQWNNMLLDYTQGESAGWMVWSFADDNSYGLYNPGFGITPWGQSFRRRADDIKNTEYTYPLATQTLNFTGGINTTSNYMFLMTSSQYRDENISSQYDPSGSYQSLGRILKSVKQGNFVPADHLDIQWPDNTTISRKPGF